MYVVKQQTLHFAKYVNYDNFGEVLLKGLKATTMQCMSLTNVMGWIQVVVSLDFQPLPNCGYTYIHECGLFEGQALAQTRHHLRIVCDALPLPCVIIGVKGGNEFT